MEVNTNTIFIPLSEGYKTITTSILSKSKNIENSIKKVKNTGGYMSFYQIIENYRQFFFSHSINHVTGDEIQSALSKESLDSLDFLYLISPAADSYIERMAQKANKLTIQHFGQTIQLFMPLYIANYCSNHCTYCGFNHKNLIERKMLSEDEISKEAKALLKTGIRHILVLTGEDRIMTPPEYINHAVTILKNHFPSVSIEIYPMEIHEYKMLKKSGVDGLTVYQEVYDENTYKKVHPKGKKRDYRYRLETPERGAEAKLRMINIGTLLGLGEKYSEIFLMAMHAKYLSDRFIDTEFSISLPRINSAEGGFTPRHIISDREFVRFLLALRLFLPKVGITISTREKESLRNHLIPLGVTRFSAGSRTTVGGYSDHGDLQAASQFSISDERPLQEVVQMIKAKGYQPIFKDWTD